MGVDGSTVNIEKINLHQTFIKSQKSYKITKRNSRVDVYKIRSDKIRYILDQDQGFTRSFFFLL